MAKKPQRDPWMVALEKRHPDQMIRSQIPGLAYVQRDNKWLIVYDPTRWLNGSGPKPRGKFVELEGAARYSETTIMANNSLKPKKEQANG